MKHTILVLEDEKPLLEAISQKLIKSGFEVLKSRSVEDALEYFNDDGIAKTVDAVWLDHYLLGERSGLDFVAFVKQDNSKWKNIPIFVVSNTASSDKVASYLEFGVTQYHTKSNVRLEEVIGEINNVLG